MLALSLGRVFPASVLCLLQAFRDIGQNSVLRSLSICSVRARAQAIFALSL